MLKEEKNNAQKEKESKKLKDENEGIAKIADGIEAAHKKKTQVKHVEIEKLKRAEAEAESYVKIATKDECDKEIERGTHKKSAKMLKINCDKVLKEAKEKQAENIKLKGMRDF